MKLKIILTAAFSLVLAVAAIFAQDAKPKSVKTPNFSGTWTLDMKKSELKENSFVKAVTMTVLQTAQNLKIEIETKYQTFAAAKTGETRGDSELGKTPAQVVTVYNYTLDGKETDYQDNDGIGKAKITPEIEKNGQLKLIQTRRFNMQTGEKVLKTIEIWTLSPDGKTLSVRRSTDKLKGDFIEKILITETSQMIFTKK